jgi:hypothetical protein
LSPDSFDACVIGPVARDINAVGAREQPPQPGGAAYYSTMVYAALGLRVAVVTRVAPADEPALLTELRARDVTILDQLGHAAGGAGHHGLAQQPRVTTATRSPIAA